MIAQIKTASANELTPLLAQLGIDISSDPFYALLADKAAFAAMLQSQSFATVDELCQAAYTSIAMCVVEEGTVFADASFFADALSQLNAGKYKLGFGLEKSGFTKLSASQQQKVLASLSKNGLTKLGELQNLFVTTTALRTINDGKTFDEKYDAVTSFLNNYPELLGISNTYAKWGLDTVRQISVRKQMANNALKKTYDLKTFQSDLDQAIKDAG